MLVENRNRRKSRDPHKARTDLQENKTEGSRFRSLSELEGTVTSISNKKGNNQDSKNNKVKRNNFEDSYAVKSAQKRVGGKSNFDLNWTKIRSGVRKTYEPINVRPNPTFVGSSFAPHIDIGPANILDGIGLQADRGSVTGLVLEPAADNLEIEPYSGWVMVDCDSKKSRIEFLNSLIRNNDEETDFSINESPHLLPEGEMEVGLRAKNLLPQVDVTSSK